MFKVVRQASCFNSSSSKSKCAEIHYQDSTFSIFCSFCGMKTCSYDDFCAHFYEHVGNFVNTSRATEEFALNDSCYNAMSFHGKIDPLKLKVVEAIKGTDEEALNTLVTEREAAKVVKYVNKRVLIEKEQISKCMIGTQEVEHKIKLDARSNNKTSESRTASEHNNQKLPKTDTDQLCSILPNVSKSHEPEVLINTKKRLYRARHTPNMCTYCGKTFRRRLQLDTHLNIHTGSKPHQCEICGRQFRAITTLARHRNTHKHNLEEFICKFCDKCFTRRAALLSHELRHTQERHIPCDECDKHFYTVNQMDTHKRKVHNKADDATLPFQCDLCMKRYRTASMLSTHKFKKHYKASKIFCEQCGKKFVDEKQLETHKIIHTCNIEKSVE
ncbi:zinc finger protein 675 isoform X2 [Eurosta solidaginis]|uniref:zinc finger protein 675 isoform X2 n=1 Tax=Eurosta solidaginis TaxID=178769 RepID=UPI0035310F07